MRYMSTNAENVVKIGPVHTNLFGTIGQFLTNFLSYRRKSYNLSPRNLRGYSSDAPQIFYAM